ncbi:hypothetical protein BJ983_000203 [Actinomycetospora corticicola]|uniref:Uncharacterized protein n=1 Tax=Actinomycetospora corticicola TaxID=663602 RepID=A0A7Y9J3R3_9PSEU|nr:hypothetical protein [Actinomycetospora corticicola]
MRAGGLRAFGLTAFWPSRRVQEFDQWCRRAA